MVTRETVHGSFTTGYWFWVAGTILFGLGVGLLPALLGCSHDFIDIGDGGTPETGGEICDNWLDDDGDTRVDCTDPDCAGPACAVCGDGLVQPGEDCESGETRECVTECGSTGTRSCDEFCRWEDACVPPAETCNETDDDCDGLTDETLERCRCTLYQDFETGVEPFQLNTEYCTMTTAEGRDGLALSVSESVFGYSCSALAAGVGAEYKAAWVMIPQPPSSGVSAFGIWFNVDGSISVHPTEVGEWEVGRWYYVEVIPDVAVLVDGVVLHEGEGGRSALQVRGPILLDDVCAR